jgi:lipoprotein signal peptidase
VSAAPDAATPADAAAPSADASAAASADARQRPGIAALIRFLLVALVGLTIDLSSKHWAFHELKQSCEPWVIVPGVLEFETMLNKGALFGIGAGQTNAFLIASAFALVLVTWLFVQTPRRRWGVQLALGGILAGALGNMYDRVFVRLDDVPERARDRRMAIFLEYIGPSEREHLYEEYPRGTGGLKVTRPEPPKLVGCVRDFIKIPTKWNLFGRKGDLWPWVFNIADMLLVGGVSILAIHIWRDRKPARKAGPGPAAT